MDQYFKTDLGIRALKQRSFQLSARQRQLLLLIGTDDFKILNSALKQRLATPELIQQLEELGLIFIHNATPTSANNPQIMPQTLHATQPSSPQISQQPEIQLPQASQELIRSPITLSEPLDETVSVPDLQQSGQNNTTTIQSEKFRSEEIKTELSYIGFEDIKQKMAGLLQAHCGLMTRQLVIQIQQAKSIRDIKFCQMQWITALQESRISPHELNLTMQQINYSLQHLQSS
ncbi:hypothetical protein [Acinetobacter sp.]|jgi:hypothetical protein|uniref:hypothetical protein n=1 Tax=Acinetobacter sp. TaxID=472 RepID=UPI002827AB60|nr:hypothetical protein [Acinetobacter sp.]MDR0238530.1 hypothetical protein [Acinetobacter sp.]